MQYLTADTYNGTYAVEQAREGSGVPVFFSGGYNSRSSAIVWNPRPGKDWLKLIDTRYPDSPIYRVIWPSGAGDSNIGKTYQNPIHKILSKPWVNPLNDFNNAESRATRCGKLLAVYISNNLPGRWPVLIGHSLGTRIVATAAADLTQSCGGGQLTAVHLLGAALHRSENWEDRLAYSTTNGVYNYYSNWEIGNIEAAYGVSIGFSSRPLGTLGVGSRRSDKQPLFTDVDVSKWVHNHKAYFDNVTLW